MADTVDADFVQRSLGDGRTLVLNVLAEGPFGLKRIPGSVNAPVDDPGFGERVRRLAPDPGQPIIVHCSGEPCAASAKAVRLLEEMGYTQVSHFRAGLQGWAQAGHDFESGGAKERRPERPGRGERPARSSAGLPVKETGRI
jgi:rhodanese-related sulfurtransferase